MQTRYAHGRASLPAPIVTVENGGSISGGNDTYYFWVKARNRVGYNTVSQPTSISIGNAKQVRIGAATFAVYNYEDWRHIIVTVSKTNDYATSRVIFKQELFDATQVNAVTPTDVVITANFNLNGSGGSVVLLNASVLPTSNLLNGFRVMLTSTQRVYEYVVGSNLSVDNTTVIPAASGQWVAVASNALLEADTNSTKELFQVNDSDLIPAKLPSLFQAPIALKYYIINNDSADLTEGELDLNAYLSDTSLGATYYVKLLGYLNLSNYSLDITNIDYVNTVVTYPTSKISLSKPLPPGRAFVIEVTPNLVLNTTISEGTYITLYPKLNPYTVIDSIPDYGAPVVDLATLKALPDSNYKDKQVRYVVSKKTMYAFTNASDLADNGDTVINPTGNAGNGRWLANSLTILPGTITPEMLSSETQALIAGGIITSTTTLAVSGTFTINTNTSETDYYILTTQTEDGSPTTINITGSTMANNTTRAVILELRQRTGAVVFHNSIVFPGGSTPLLSGNGKTDCFVLELVKGADGVTKKRGFMVQKDIG